MPDEAPQESLPSEPTDQPTPKQSPVSPEPVSEPVAAATVMPTHVDQPSGSNNKPKSTVAKKVVIGLTVILAVLVVVALVGSYLQSNQKQTTVTKKDIPNLTYGIDDTALSKTYPFSNNTATAVQVDSQLFEGLVQYQQQTKIVPQLATGWSNPDNVTWVFTLRQGVKFHSGRTMTATDVKSSLDYAVAHAGDNNQNTPLAAASSIKKVDIASDNTIKITTDGPDPVLLNQLSGLYIMDSKGTIGDPDIGTGPYVIKPGTKPSNTEIDLAAFDGYHGGHVYTRNLQIKAADANALTTGAENGRFDLVGPLRQSQLTGIKAYQQILVPEVGTSFLGLNTVNPKLPFTSLAARQAAQYALNIPAILKAGSLRGVQDNQLVPQTIPGYDPSIQTVPYDPAKAKQLLATVKNASVPMTLNYSDTIQTPLLEEVAKELNAVGFNVKPVEVVDLDTLVTDGLGGKDDIFYVTYDTNTLDGLDMFNSVIEGAGYYQSSQVDALVSQASTTIDPAARLAILQKISRTVAADLPVVPLYTQIDTFSLQKPYYMQVDMPSVQAGVFFWKVYQK